MNTHITIGGELVNRLFRTNTPALRVLFKGGTMASRGGAPGMEVPPALVEELVGGT